MPKLGPLAVSIRDPTTKNCYEEHKVDRTGAGVQCYIESRAGSPFSILFELDDDWCKTWPTFLAKVHLDGKVCRRPIIGTCNGTSAQVEEISGCPDSNNRFLPFQFSARQFLGSPFRCQSSETWLIGGRLQREDAVIKKRFLCLGLLSSKSFVSKICNMIQSGVPCPHQN